MSPRIVAIVRSRGQRHIAYSEADAYHLRDIHGGHIVWAS